MNAEFTWDNLAHSLIEDTGISIPNVRNKLAIHTDEYVA